MTKETDATAGDSAPSRPNAQLRELGRERDEAQRSAAFWQARSLALEEAEAAIKASLSWRITAPLRAARSFPRRLRHRVGRLRRFVWERGLGAIPGLILRKLVGTRPPPVCKVDVLFVIGVPEGESKRYRVHNIAQALGRRGAAAEVIGIHQLPRIVEDNLDVRTLVLFRTPYWEHLGLEIALAHVRARGGRVVFDVDDLVFDPDVVDRVHGVSILGPEEQAHYMDGVLAYRRMLLACDWATVPTASLARAVEQAGVPARVTPNSISLDQIVAAAALVDVARSARLTIGYFSGSRTHQMDFAQVEAALLQLMAARADFDLLIVGYLELGAAWEPYADRVRRSSFLPHLEMLALVAECDINIAPLELDNPFCEAKSELKFFEAALVRTPTVASPTEPFRDAIESGVTGFLASNADEWRQGLSALLDDAGLRRRIGEAARAAALARFGPDALAEAAASALLGPPPATRPTAAPRPHRARGLRIDWVIPPLIIGGGGHRNILRAAHHLQQFGHDLTLRFTHTLEPPEELLGMVRRHFYPFEGRVVPGDSPFRPSDVILATHWSTVDTALVGRSQTREIIYFVQDFEPAFSPMGSEYLLAENTYRRGLYCITSGPWCERLLRRDYGLEADHFRFPIDRTVYRPRRRTKANRNVVFFAKPEMPRRCFEIGAMALSTLHRLAPDVEIILFGSPAVRQEALAFPATILSIVPALDDLAQIYANADLGLAFSTTNPSLVPYEMMASGCPVVDLDRPGNEANYDDRRDIALLADPIPETMARQIADLLGRPDELKARRLNGLGFAATFPTEEEMARSVERLIVERLKASASA